MAGLGIFSWFSYPLPIQDRLYLIKQAGFDAASLWWGESDNNYQPEKARKLGLDIDNIHVPFHNPNDFWLDGLSGEDYLNMLISCVDDCNIHCISTAVIHITGFSGEPAITQIGIDRIKKLVDFAERKEINLAFENLNRLQHLDYIFDNLESNRVGFCYDSGHENCNHPNANCLSRYGDRLFAVHLDDNFGDSDAHLLPYGGTVDWNKLKENFLKCREINYLTLEVDFNPKYEKSARYNELSAVEFLSLAFERLSKIRGTDNP